MKRRIRRSLVRGLYVCGILPLWARIRLRNRAVVLMYHRVLSREEMSRGGTQGGMTVEAGTFEKQVRYICNHFKPISLSRFIDHLEKSIPFPDKTCLITFDDGWRDNFVNAYPVLRENRVPAVVFLPTDFIGSLRRFWQQELADLLAAARKRCREDQGFSARNKRLFDIVGLREIMESDEKRLAQEIAAFLGVQKKKPIADTEKLIHALNQALPAEGTAEEKKAVFLNWDEVQIMARDGIAFGSHGKSHALLPRVNVTEAEREIRESKEIMERNLGQSVDAFSYPNGDCDASVVRSVQDYGYRVAFGTESGFVSLDTDPFRIRRVNAHQDMTETIPLFLARIAGLW